MRNYLKIELVIKQYEIRNTVQNCKTVIFLPWEFGEVTRAKIILDIRSNMVTAKKGKERMEKTSVIKSGSN